MQIASVNTHTRSVDAHNRSAHAHAQSADLHLAVIHLFLGILLPPVDVLSYLQHLFAASEQHAFQLLDFGRDPLPRLLDGMQLTFPLRLD